MRARRLLLAFAASACGCAPLTYENEGAVDFEQYRSVRVSVTSTLDSVRATDYLAAELRAESGFAHVTVDPSEPIDAVLDVTVSTTLETMTNEEGDVDEQYSGEANYRLSSPTDSNIDSGTEIDTSEYEQEVIEDTLDQVAAHYVPPYRL